ncbi:hypothetical protein BDW74DRAFT_186973 [Aspergillus multicolor]|uniref:uncharacterized protein n=1 Tax=Aspergillus multicolor TaxID=41759 RepID=UPI003CCCE506
MYTRRILAQLPRRRLRASRILLSSLLLWFLFYTYCRTLLWRDPHSAFFQDSHVYDLDYSLHRERESWHFIARHNAASNPPKYTEAGERRPSSDTYFEASVGSLLEDLSEKERAVLYLTVLFADTDPAVHPSWGLTWVDRLVDEAGGYNVSEEQLEDLRMLEKERNFYKKGVFDYIYALRACQEVNARYTIVFEDDIILAAGWFAKTLKSMASISQDHGRGQDQATKKPWLYLRLFYTETALGWNDSNAAYRHMPIIFLALMASTFCLLLLLRRSRFPLLHLYLDTLSIAVISLLCVPAFMALIYMVGKYSLMPLRGVVEMNKYGCCTQGLLFPADQVDGLIAYLEARGHGQTDSLIEEYANSNGLNRYAVAPPVLQHVGLKSSRDNTDMNTQSTWAFWFEANEPGVLRREHAELLEDEDVQELLRA